MNAALLGLLAGAGVVVATDDGGPDTRSPIEPKPTTPKPGTTFDASKTAVGSFFSARVGFAPGTGVGSIPTSQIQSSPLLKAPTATSADGMTAEAEAAIRAELEKKYNELSGEAKKKACEALKAQFPDDSNVQGLNCADATFQKVLTVVAAAAGTALCGPTCGALGVIAAQYFGEDINELWNDYVASVWNAPADHDTETVSLAEACARGDAQTKAYLKQQAINRGITPPPECG